MTYEEMPVGEPAETRLVWPYLIVVLLAIVGNSLRTLHYHWIPVALTALLPVFPG